MAGCTSHEYTCQEYLVQFILVRAVVAAVTVLTVFLTQVNLDHLGHLLLLVREAVATHTDMLVETVRKSKIVKHLLKLILHIKKCNKQGMLD